MVRSSSSLAKINAIRTRLQQPPLIALPPLPERLSRRNVFDIFLPALLLTTLTLTLAYGLHSATVYYALNWVPKLVVDLSFSASQGATVSAWTSAGGIVGALIVAALTARVDVGRLTALLLFGTAAFLMVFAHTAANLHQLIATSALLGACLYGGQASLYALMTRAFPTRVRATGVGFVTGVGRLGGILSPSVSGFLMGRVCKTRRCRRSWLWGRCRARSFWWVPAHWGGAECGPRGRTSISGSCRVVE